MIVDWLLWFYESIQFLSFYFILFCVFSHQKCKKKTTTLFFCFMTRKNVIKKSVRFHQCPVIKLMELWKCWSKNAKWFDTFEAKKKILFNCSTCVPIIFSTSCFFVFFFNRFALALRLSLFIFRKPTKFYFIQSAIKHKSYTMRYKIKIMPIQSATELLLLNYVQILFFMLK